MLKVGVIGVGHLGSHHARIYSQLDGVELVGVADLLRERAESAAAAHGGLAVTDFRELLSEVDALSIAVPTEDHAAVGLECLSAGVDLLVEKPIAKKVTDANSLITVAREKNRILQVGHVERFNPVVRAAKEIATRPQFFEVHRLNIFSMRSLDIDVVLDLMIHDIDIVLSFVDSRVAEIRAVGIPVLSDKADIANARIEFENGCVANLTASRVSSEKVRKLRFFQPNDYVSLDFDRQKGHILSLENKGIKERKIQASKEEPLKLQLESFLSSVRERTQPRVTGEAGLKALEITMLINEQIDKCLTSHNVGEEERSVR